MLNFSVNSDRCGGCAACVGDCPARIIQLPEGGLPFIAPEDESKCVECQHCLAVCPTAAISIFGLDPDKSFDLGDNDLPEFDKMVTLARGRRSVRRYEDKNVDAELVKELLAAVANAPTGTNSRKLTLTVIDDRTVLDRLRKKVMQALRHTDSAGGLPERYSFLSNYVRAYFDDGKDPIFRGAPHALLISAAPTASTGAEDVIIALSYFELLAQSAGLGTVWCGLLKWALEAAPELRELVGMPDGHPYYPMLFGYPAVKYARTVQRDDAAAVRRPTIPA